MTLREHERRAKQRRQSDPDRDRGLDQYRILSFADWCRLNGISQSTGRRLLRNGHGPAVTRLSDRRVGISVGANAEWQAARTFNESND
jgi:predicted DNA-binding transcriptional regulator AlpA